jgi:hypothetical protein
VAGEQFTLHRALWRFYLRLPRVGRILIVVVAVGALVNLAFLLLSGPGETQRVRSAVATAVREATGPDPAGSCSALSPAGLSQLLSQFGSGPTASTGVDPLHACRQLVPRLRAQATPKQIDDLAHGSVSSVQFRDDGSALVIYVSDDRRLGTELTMTRRSGRWLIDRVAGGEIAGAGESGE